MRGTKPMTLPDADLLAAGSTLPLDLPPTLCVVPGGAYAGLCLRVGREVLDASVAARHLARPDWMLPDGDDATEYLAGAVMDRARLMLARHEQAARSWLQLDGRDHPAGRLPFQVGLVRPARPEAANPRTVRPLRDAGELYGRLAVLLPDHWVVPTFDVDHLHHRPHGTGVAGDYFPAGLLGLAARPAAWLPLDPPPPGPPDGKPRRPERRYERAAYHGAGVFELLRVRKEAQP